MLSRKRTTPLVIKHLPPSAAADTSALSVARQQDAARYISALVFELRQISIAAGLDEITGPLEQAYYQAAKVTARQDEASDTSMQPAPESVDPAWIAD
jgi:hypothetical protein